MINGLFLVTVLVVLGILFKILKGAMSSYRVIFGGLLLWLAFITVLANTGFLMQFNKMPPNMAIVLLPPILLLIYVACSNRVQSIIDKTPQSVLIYAQSFRIVVETILFLLIAKGVVPEIMSWNGRNFDIVVALSAPIVGYLYCQRKVLSTKALKLWNYLGILMLVNVVIHGLLSVTTPFQVFMVEPANTFVATWPYVWLPGFLVPAAIFFHIVSIRKGS